MPSASTAEGGEGGQRNFGEKTIQKLLVKDEAVSLLKSGVALKEKILAAKAENYAGWLKAFEKKAWNEKQKFYA